MCSRLDFRRSVVPGLPLSAGSFPEQRLVIEPICLATHRCFMPKIRNRCRQFEQYSATRPRFRDVIPSKGCPRAFELQLWVMTSLELYYFERKDLLLARTSLNYVFECGLLNCPITNRLITTWQIN